MRAAQYFLASLCALMGKNVKLRVERFWPAGRAALHQPGTSIERPLSFAVRARMKGPAFFAHSAGFG